MFILDALIGNWDRHNGNWGFLYDTQTDEMRLAPVFDCGSSLFPQADEEKMRVILSDRNELNLRIFNQPLSSIMQNGRKINYFEFISSLQNEDCNQVLKRIAPKIDLEKIFRIIDETPYLTELQRAFYKTVLSERKGKIIGFSFKKLLKQEREK